MSVCVASLENGLESMSRGWDSVGRRLAGASRSLPSLDANDDEAQPLHQAAASGRHGSSASSQSGTEDSTLPASCT